ncbi:MAG TPA: MBL fold metallo-hydrolase [Xanthobacteraceae bacterium]|jgi:glyoxylase-like metal-dependent hydrolase (beta-lactamase superfamily II)
MMREFRCGDLELKGLSDGILKTSLDFVLGMERAKSEALVGATNDGSLFIPVNNFLFRREGATVLIDSGAGNSMQPTLGKLPADLKAAGIDPADVTHIVLTHMHPDHANGLVDDAGEAAYPNAEILVHAQELDFWMAENDGSESEAVKRTRARNRVNLKPYGERIRPMHDGEEVLGCAPLPAPGHSPGHTCWRVGAGRDAFIAWGDLVHFSAIQIAHPNTAVKYDLDPDLARRSRLRMLDMIATEGLAIAGAHVNGPGLGYLTRKGTGYTFESA